MRPLVGVLLLGLNCGLLLLLQRQDGASAIRISDSFSSSSPIVSSTASPASKTAIFALGSFWHGEAVFGCLLGVLRTTAGYTGGSKSNPEYRNVGDQAEAVEVSFLFLDPYWTTLNPCICVHTHDIYYNPLNPKLKRKYTHIHRCTHM